MSFPEIHCREGTLFSGKKQACGLKGKAADLERIIWAQVRMIVDFRLLIVDYLMLIIDCLIFEKFQN